jgi:rubrerythrin
MPARFLYDIFLYECANCGLVLMFSVTYDMPEDRTCPHCSHVGWTYKGHLIFQPALDG